MKNPFEICADPAFMQAVGLIDASGKQVASQYMVFTYADHTKTFL
jgi:hypothetical protein